jgi:hypothetical protein
MMPMSFCPVRFSVISSLVFFVVALKAQPSLPEPVISEREFRFREVEQRALDLSKRLSELTGTEPIELIDRNRSLSPVRYDSSAQRAFDVLPGPLEEIEPELPEPEEEATPVVYASDVQRVVPTTQQRKGDYYIMPSLGFLFSSNTKFVNGSTNQTLDGELGNSLALNFGKRIDNWKISCRIGYRYLDYESFMYGDIYNPDQIFSEEELYAISLSAGYAIPITERFSTNGGIMFGTAFRKNFYKIENDIDPALAGYDWVGITTEVDSSFVLTYGLSLGFEYLFVNNFSGYCGYRLMGLSSNKSFEGAFQHLLELGVGANF